MEIRPDVRLSEAAAAFAADDPRTIVVIVAQGANKYRVRIDLPGPAKQLHGLAFLIRGEKTMHLEGTLDNVTKQLTTSKSSPTASRIRRFCAPAAFGISFDFPEEILPRIFEPRRCSNGTFEFCVYKATHAQPP